MHGKTSIVAGMLVGLLLIALGECAVCPIMACPMPASATVVCAAQMSDSSGPNSNCCQKMNVLNGQHSQLVVHVHTTQLDAIQNACGLATLAGRRWIIDMERQRWGPTVALYTIDRSLRI